MVAAAVSAVLAPAVVSNGELLPDSLRVVSANMAHISIDDLVDPLEELGVTKEIFLAEQSDFLESLVVQQQANVFALQEVSRNLVATLSTDWPASYDAELDSVQLDPECREFGHHYAPGHFWDGEPAASDGNALITNVAWNYSAKMDLYAGCPGERPTDPDNVWWNRNASVMRLHEGANTIWVMSLHLATCDDKNTTDPGDDSFAANWCQLNNLFYEIDAIDPNVKIVVAGDFNIKATANTSGRCIGDTFHPLHYSYMMDQFVNVRSFLHIASTGRDHVFVRDPAGEFGAITADILDAADQAAISGYAISDHNIIVTDIQLGPPGSCAGCCGGQVWVDFGYSGTEAGSFDQPYNSLTEGVDAAEPGDAINIKPGSSNESLSASKPLTIRAYRGTATIGE